MNYSDIIPTHNSLRNLDTFKFFCEVPVAITNVSNTTPVLILDIEDKLYLNDAHHRMTAAALVNYPIEDIKKVIKKFTVKDMLQVDFKVGWLTPYDPRTHVRNSSRCKWFKEAIMNIYNAELYADDREYAKNLALETIERYKTAYMEERVAQTLFDLIPKELNHGN